MSNITVQHAIGLIEAISETLTANKDMLNQLDSALGDGDHGTGITTGFAEAVNTISTLESPALSDVWSTSAKVLINRMGGASGALFGTFFLKGVALTKEKTTLSKSDMNAIFEAGLDGVKQRGKSDVGDKTMVDALSPAVVAFKQQENFIDAWQEASTAARTGAESTKNLVAKHGRAKFTGERAVGHQDAGATSIALMFEAMQNYWENID